MSHPYWPLFDLRLGTPDLELCPMTEADQTALSDLLPDDVELDPAAPTFPVDPRLGRGMALHQTYWRAFGTWRTESWRLPFAVRAAGELIGAQEIEGDDFVALRTVETSSFLIPGARGRGLGQQMRRAVLALAFGPLQAQAAITEAWRDNHASKGVSRVLGYRPNGESLHRRGDHVDVMVHMRLRRADWLAAGPHHVTIDGFEPCRPLFGLDSA